MIITLCAATSSAFARTDRYNLRGKPIGLECDTNAKPKDIFADTCHKRLQQSQSFCDCALDFYLENMLMGPANKTTFDYQRAQYNKTEKQILSSTSFNKAELSTLCDKDDAIDEYNYLSFRGAPLNNMETPDKIRKDTLNKLSKNTSLGASTLSHHCSMRRVLKEFDAKMERKN